MRDERGVEARGDLRPRQPEFCNRCPDFTEGLMPRSAPCWN